MVQKILSKAVEKMQQRELATIKAMASGSDNPLANVAALQKALDNRQYALDHEAAAYKRTIAAKRIAPKVPLHPIRHRIEFHLLDTKPLIIDTELIYFVT